MCSTDDGGIAGGGGGCNMALEIEVVLSEQDRPLRTRLGGVRKG